jgi:hypothetical protein
MKKLIPYALGSGLMLVILLLHSNYYRHKEMPPGWILLTNGRGKYAAQETNSGFIIDRSVRSFGSRGISKQNAINRAWWQYEFMMEENKKAETWKPAE